MWWGWTEQRGEGGELGRKWKSASYLTMLTRDNEGEPGGDGSIVTTPPTMDLVLVV